MERVTKYIARDQQEFLNEKDCIAHERGLDFTEAFSQFVVTHVGTTPCETEEAQAAFDKLTDAIRKNPEDFEAVLNAARGKGVKKIKKKKPQTKTSKTTKAPATPSPELEAAAIAAKWLSIEDQQERLTVVEELHTVNPALFALVKAKLGEAFFAALPKPAAADDETPPEPAE